MTLAEKIAQMQTKKTTYLVGPTKMPNGKWRHPHSNGDFDSEDACRADYRFCKEWGCK